MSGRVSFVGAGPGAADLITLRGAKRIAEADIVVWAASLVDADCVRDHARPDAELIDSSKITYEEMQAIYHRAAVERLKVARVHSGDPALWSAVQEQYDSCQRLGLEVDIVPGVSAFSAAAAVAGRELTVPEVAQSVILTRLEGGKTPMPAGEHIREFARHGTTMAIFLSAARSGQLAEELLAGGYEQETPVVIAYKVTWPDELILHTTLGELVETVKQHKMWRHTLFLVGPALHAGGTRSYLYNAGHFHTYRKANPVARRTLLAEHATTSEYSGRSRVTAWAGASRPTSTSVAAWSAVSGWQETARSNGRSGYRSRTTADRALRAVPPDQETLALQAEPTPVEPAVPVQSTGHQQGEQKPASHRQQQGGQKPVRHKQNPQKQTAHRQSGGKPAAKKGGRPKPNNANRGGKPTPPSAG